MSESKNTSLVVDTNFIIQKRNLQEVIKALDDSYKLYVTQVSIDERIGQQIRELKQKYDKIPKIKKEYKNIAKFDEIIKYEKSVADLKKRVQKAYEETTGINIIPFYNNEGTLSLILERANLKTPPFILESKSDKGFKDALIWLSLLDYFKSSGENEIVFITDDNGFLKNESFLCVEFNTYTEKTIRIKPNNYFKELFQNNEEITESFNIEPLPNFSMLRDEIYDTIESIAYTEAYNDYGNEYCSMTFELIKKVDAHYMEIVFFSLRKIVEDHIFDKSLPASAFLELDIRIIDKCNILMTDIENLLKLYENIHKNYSDYLQQFYSATANILNRNFVEPDSEEDDKLPF